jgi:hypothetical protein
MSNAFADLAPPKQNAFADLPVTQTKPRAASPALPQGRYGSTIEQEARRLDPGLSVTGRGRTAARNAQLAGSAPNSAHLTDNARDFQPGKGETQAQAYARINKEFSGHGYKVLNEGRHGDQGPHIHVEATSGAKDFTSNAFADLAPGKRNAFADLHQPVPAPVKAQTPKTAAPKAATPKATDPSWLETGEAAIKAIPSSLYAAGKGIVDQVMHPLDTVGRLGSAQMGLYGQLGLPVDERSVDLSKRMGHDMVDPYTSVSKFKRKVATDPVGVAMDASVIVAPFESGLRAVARAGERAATGAKLGGVKGAVKMSLAGDEAVAGNPDRWAGPKGDMRGIDLKRATAAAKGLATLRARTPDQRAADDYGQIQRTAVGKHKLDASRAAAEFEKHQKVLGNAPVEDQRAVIAAIESASDTREPNAFKSLPEKYRAAAQSLRKVARDYRRRIEQVMKTDDREPGFVEDYYVHLWKQKPSEVMAAMSKGGSGRNLKARTIPTYQEGLDKGLTPVHENPLDAMTAYVDNMSRYLATQDIQKGMRASGLAKWVFEHQMPDGYMKLNGGNTVRDAKPMTKDVEGSPVLTGQIGRRVLAAPVGAAKRYNAFVDQGLVSRLRSAGHETAAKAARAFSGVSNVMVNTALTGTGFHPTLVAGKAIGSDLAAAANHALRGRPLEAIKSLAHAPFAPFATPYEGRAMGKRLLKGDEAMTSIDMLWRDAGGRMTNDSVYRTSLKPNFLQSKLRGTLLRDVKDALKATTKGSIGERASATADLVGRAMDTMSAPIFQHYVPAMKRGVFEREMTAEMQARPDMAPRELHATARKVMDNIDGRLGELARDNIFWSQTKMDVARLAFLSPSWQYGDVRLLLDGVRDLPASMTGIFKGKGVQHGTAAAAGIAGSYFLMNGISNYLFTGQRPKGQDWMAFRTGATQSDGTPERAMVPSVMKDFFGVVRDPMQEAVNKISPLPKALYQGADNQDWRGLPIYRPRSLDAEDLRDDAPDNLKENRLRALAGHFGGQFMPFGLQDNPNGDNSGLGGGARLLGMRPAGKAYSDPDGYAEGQKRRDKAAVDKETYYENNARQRKEKQ